MTQPGDDPLLSSPIHVQALYDLGTARGIAKVMRDALERLEISSAAAPRQRAFIRETLRKVREIEAAQASPYKPAMVARIVEAAAAPPVEAPADKEGLVRWLRDGEAEIEAAQAAGRGEGRDG